MSAAKHPFYRRFFPPPRITRISRTASMGAATMGATINGSTCMADACGTAVAVLVILSAAIRDGGELPTGASGHFLSHVLRRPHLRLRIKKACA